jgi:hypothetical protein
MKNDWMLINYQIGKNGKNVSQTWQHTCGRQFALSGISLEDYCKNRPDDVNAKEILEKSKSLGLLARLSL